MKTEYLLNFFKKYRSEIAAILLTFVISCFIFLLSNLRFANDDQFILYKYIDNIVSGRGLVYNFGEKVLGFTSPLFTLLCVFVKYFFPNVYTPDIVAYINIILLSFSAAFFYRVCRKFISPKIILFAVLIFAFNLSKTIPEGMETPLFIFDVSCFFRFIISPKILYLSDISLAHASCQARCRAYCGSRRNFLVAENRFSQDCSSHHGLYCRGASVAHFFYDLLWFVYSSVTHNETSY